ncbi:unnamed protein product [Linum tenue]|jgi:hypothetical protein
MGI